MSKAKKITQIRNLARRLDVNAEELENILRPDYFFEDSQCVVGQYVNHIPAGAARVLSAMLLDTNRDKEILLEWADILERLPAV